jgi:hypothetical protein
MDQIGDFVVELLGTAAGAAAGVAGTVAGGPLVGAAAGAAVTKVTSSLLGTFLHVQDAQLRSFEDLNRNLSGGLARIEAGLFRIEGQVQQVQADLRLQLEEPWQTARLYLEQAAEPQLRTQTRDDYLIRARDKLFEAYSVAKDDVRRALVAERLAAIAVMLNDGPSARKWLVGAYPIVAGFAKAVGAEVERLFEIDWDPETVTSIVNRVRVVSWAALSTKRRPALAAWQAARPALGARADPPWSESAGNKTTEFWVRYIRATAADREAIRKSLDLRDKALEKLVQVHAIRGLYWMVEDLRQLRVASLRLGGNASALPEYTLVVDLLPLRKPEVRVIAAAP